MQRLEVALPGVASSVPPARHFVQRTLEAWGLSAVGWTAALVVTELAANAVLHAGSEFRVVVSRDGDRVRIEVHDGSGHLPRQRRQGAEATTGRGLRLIADLALGWGADPLPDGKAVWAELSASADPFVDDENEQDVDSLLAGFPDDVDEPDGPAPFRALLPVAA